MGNSGSSQESTPPQEPETPQQEEEQFGVMISAKLARRLAEDVDRVTRPLSQQQQQQKTDDAAHSPHHEPAQQPAQQPITIINTEKLSEMLEVQRHEKRTEYDTARAAQLKLEEDALKRVHDKIDALTTTYVRKEDPTSTCASAQKEVLDCYSNSDDTGKCKPFVDKYIECAKRAS